MAENKSPAFQFYAENFLNGTAHMTPTQVGIYIRLLCHQWHMNGLPNDDKRLMAMSGGKKSDIEVVKEKFLISADGLLRNGRMEKARQAQEEFRKKASEAGKKSAQKRQGTLEGALNEPTNETGNQNPTLQSSSSSSVIHQQHAHAHEVYAEKIFTEEWRLDRENVELQLNVRREITPEDVAEFNRHLKTQNKHHVHRSQYLEHFRNWLNTKPKEKISAKKETSHHGKQNEQNTKLGRNSRESVANYINNLKDDGHSEPDSSGANLKVA